MHVTKKFRAFTLIELLVVVSIIALLVSILLPALGKAREQAKAVACLSNLRQMALGMAFYAQENEDRAMAYSLKKGEFWFCEIAPYLGNKQFKDNPDLAVRKGMEVMVCPSTQKRETPPGVDDSIGTAKLTWQVGTWETETTGSLNAEGSYGINCWVCNEGDFSGGILPEENFWGKYSSIKQDTPLFGDSFYVGSWPFEGDYAPYELVNNGGYDKNSISYVPGTSWPHARGYFMGRFCVDRHGMAINISFTDGRAEKVALEDLWTLKWHKNFKPRTDDIVVPRPR